MPRTRLWPGSGYRRLGDPSRLEGFHSPTGLLLVLDEMKAISDAAFDSVLGALSGEDAKLLVTSVPGGAGSGGFWKGLH